MTSRVAKPPFRNETAGARSASPRTRSLCLALLAILLLRATAATSAVQPGDRAPLFALRAVDGGTYSLDRGLRDHPVMVAFITFPCKPCEESVPGLNALSDLHDRSDSVETVCIAVSGAKAVERMVRSQGFNRRARILLDETVDGRHTTADAYGVLGTPMFFLVGKGGTVLWKHIGQLRWEEARGPILEAITGE